MLISKEVLFLAPININNPNIMVILKRQSYINI